MTKKHLEPFEQSFQLAEHALLDLRKDAVPAWPEVYEVVYSYLSGHFRDVVEAVDETRDSDGSLNIDALMDVHERYFSCDRSLEVADDVGSKISEEIRRMLSAMQQAGERSEKIDKALVQMETKFSDIKTPDQLHGVVKILSDLTGSIAKNNRSLTTRLNRSAEQINILHQDLEKARNESNSDALTGLANRKKFDMTIKRLLKAHQESEQNFTLILADIDHFKRFNDQFGHQTGDQVLRLVSHTLKVSLKGGDLAARYGGEEFAILLPRTTAHDALIVAEHIREAVMGKELVKRSTGENLGRITISLGVSEVLPGDSIGTLVERADKALYAAKKNGRNKSVIAPEHQASNEPAAALI